MRLAVHEIRVDLAKQPRQRPGRAPWRADPERRVKRRANRADAVHGHTVQGRHRMLGRGRRADDVDVMAVAGEPGGQPVREMRGTVDVGRIGVGGDDDPQRLAEPLGSRRRAGRDRPGEHQQARHRGRGRDQLTGMNRFPVSENADQDRRDRVDDRGRADHDGRRTAGVGLVQQPRTHQGGHDRLGDRDREQSGGGSGGQRLSGRPDHGRGETEQHRRGEREQHAPGPRAPADDRQGRRDERNPLRCTDIRRGRGRRGVRGQYDKSAHPADAHQQRGDHRRSRPASAEGDGQHQAQHTDRLHHHQRRQGERENMQPGGGKREQQPEVPPRRAQHPGQTCQPQHRPRCRKAHLTLLQLRGARVTAGRDHGASYR